MAPLRPAHKRLIAMPLIALSIPFVSQVPMMDFTVLGLAVKVAIVAMVVIVAAFRAKIFINTATAFEYFVIIAATALIISSSLAGALMGRLPELSMLSKFFILNLACYVVGRTICSHSVQRRTLDAFVTLAGLAAVQAVLATVAEFLGARQLWEIPISDGRADYRYYLSWYGALGGDVWNGRTNFYFSEATHFAHFLFAGLVIAMSARRYWMTVIILAGFATTFSAAASAVLILYIFGWCLFYGKLRVSVALFISLFVLGYFLWIYATVDDAFFSRLFERSHSIADKLATYAYALRHLADYPFGAGVFNSSRYFGLTVNTSGGLFNWMVWFGLPGIALLVVVFFRLLWASIETKRSPHVSLLIFGLIAVNAATLSHGPLPKYYLLFLVGLAVTMAQQVKPIFQRVPRSSPRAESHAA